MRYDPIYSSFPLFLQLLQDPVQIFRTHPTPDFMSFFLKNNPLNPIAPFHECMGWGHVLEHKQAISVHILKNWYFLSAAIN